MPEWEMDWIKMNLNADPRDEEQSLHYRLDKADIEKRLNLLFGPDELPKVANPAEKQQDGLLDAIEAATTDTDRDFQGSMPKMSPNEINEEMRAKITPKPKKEREEADGQIKKEQLGIRSDDEDD